MFDQLTDRIGGLVDRLRGSNQNSTEVLAFVEQELRDALLAADVASSVVDAIAQRVTTRIKVSGEKDPSALVEQFIKGFEQAVMDTLGSASELRLPKAGVSVWMMVGLQGTGKTTSSAKIARWARAQGHKPYLVPLDLRRPAAIEQLQKLGSDLEIPVFDTPTGGRAVKIAQKAVSQAQREGCDLVILDTAGRLSIDAELMEELTQVRKKIKPDETLLVIDGMQGQTSVETARTFDTYVSLSGLVLTKMDGDAKGGAAFSARHVTNKPIRFLGTGEKPDQLELFEPSRIVNRILDRGDLEALASKAEEALDMEQVEQLGRKMLESSFTLEDFKAQLEQMEKLGSMDSVLKMLPGGKKLGKMVGDMDAAQSEMKRTKAIINSMTPLERRNARLISGSRRKRIAQGSGTSVTEVNKLLKEFQRMQKMMQQVRKMNPAALQAMTKGLGKGRLPF